MDEFSVSSDIYIFGVLKVQIGPDWLRLLNGAPLYRSSSLYKDL